jgi:hypothetical protein
VAPSSSLLSTLIKFNEAVAINNARVQARTTGTTVNQIFMVLVRKFTVLAMFLPTLVKI